MLCFHQIQQLFDKMDRRHEMSEEDQSPNSNGDKAICKFNPVKIANYDRLELFVGLSFAFLFFNNIALKFRDEFILLFLSLEIYPEKVALLVRPFRRRFDLQCDRGLRSVEFIHPFMGPS